MTSGSHDHSGAFVVHEDQAFDLRVLEAHGHRLSDAG